MESFTDFSISPRFTAYPEPAFRLAAPGVSVTVTHPRISLSKASCVHGIKVVPSVSTPSPVVPRVIQ